MDSLFAVMALNGIRKIPYDVAHVDRKFEKAYEALLSLLDATRIALDFSFRTNPLHGDSQVLRSAILEASRNNRISLDNPLTRTITIKDENDWSAILEHSPIDTKTLTNVAREAHLI